MRYHSLTHHRTRSSRAVIPGAGVQFHAGRTPGGTVQPPGDGTRGNAACRRASRRIASSAGRAAGSGRDLASCMFRRHCIIAAGYLARTTAKNAASSATGPTGLYRQPARLAPAALRTQARMRTGQRKRRRYSRARYRTIGLLLVVALYVATPVRTLHHLITWPMAPVATATRRVRPVPWQQPRRCRRNRFRHRGPSQPESLPGAQHRARRPGRRPRKASGLAVPCGLPPGAPLRPAHQEEDDPCRAGRCRNRSTLSRHWYLPCPYSELPGGSGIPLSGRGRGTITVWRAGRPRSCCRCWLTPNFALLWPAQLGGLGAWRGRVRAMVGVRRAGRSWPRPPRWPQAWAVICLPGR